MEMEKEKKEISIREDIKKESIKIPRSF